jgi:hypothetical protein
MACEALAMLDCTGDIDSWARRFARAGGASVDPVVPAGFEWRQALGDYHRLGEWIGYFTQAIDDDGWPAVVATWVPRLMPALRTDCSTAPSGPPMPCGPLMLLTLSLRPVGAPAVRRPSPVAGGPGGSMAGVPARVSEIFDKSPAGHHAPGGDPVNCQRRAAARGELI